MNAIGGYFGLELHEGSAQYHETAYTYKSGRSSLHAILKHIKPLNVYIPYYCCDALRESFAAAGCAYSFYAINETLQPETLPLLEREEYFLYINYFDLCGDVVKELSQRYGAQLIVDCTQAFFRKGNGRSWFFNSCRKFFGVPDGSFVYPPDGIQLPPAETLNENYLTGHLLQRFNGHPREGYQAFKQNEALCNTEIAGMSRLTRYLISHIPYKKAIEKRRSNFLYLHYALGNWNQLALMANEEAVPMAYPLLPPTPVDRNSLAARNIFVPTFWPEIQAGNHGDFETERILATYMLPLPVDHRYGTTDLDRIIQAIKNSL